MAIEDDEITTTDDAQSTCQMLEGDISDLDDHLESEEWTEALELLDTIEERITSIRTFVTKKVEH